MDRLPITQDDVKTILEWLGFTSRKEQDLVLWSYPEQIEDQLAVPESFNLEFIFQYIVPKLFELGLDYKMYSEDDYHFVTINVRFRPNIMSASLVATLDASQAWIWAILVLIKETKYGVL